MPGYWINGGAVVATPDYYRQNSIIDEERGTLYRPAHRWDRNRRAQSSQRDLIGFCTGWSWGGNTTISPDGLSGADTCFGNNDLADVYNIWDQWYLGNKGTTRPYYIYGVVYDASNLPVVGAQVESFVTATDVRDGVTVSAGDGSYQVPCYNRTATHYVNAYKTGSPDSAGESANTLTPTS